MTKTFGELAKKIGEGFEVAEVVISHPFAILPRKPGVPRGWHNSLRADSIILSGDKTRDLPGTPDLSGGPPYFLQESTATDWPGYSGHVASEEKGKTRETVGR